MKILKIITILLVLTSCQNYSSNEAQTPEERTIAFLDKADKELAPCLDAIYNSNSTDLAIMIPCQRAVFLYRKYGGHDYLAPLYLSISVDNKKDIERANKLVKDLDIINERFYQIESRNKDNLYFQQILLTQSLALSADEFSRNRVGEDNNDSQTTGK